MPKKQKKTALGTQSRRKVSADSKQGLIVTEKNPEHSAGTECVLDNRSHRTKEFPSYPPNPVESAELSFMRLWFRSSLAARLTSLLEASSFKNRLAEVVELVDALASGASGCKPVGVRVPPSAF